MIIRNKPAYCIVRLYNRFIIFNCYGHFSKQNFEFLSFSSDCYLCNVTTYLTSSSSFSLSLSLSHSLSLSLLDRLWLMLDRCWVKIHLLSLFVIPNRHSPCVGTHTFLSLSLYHKSLYFIRTMFDHANRS